MGIIITEEQRLFALNRALRIPSNTIDTEQMLDVYIIPFLASEEIDVQNIAGKHMLQVRSMAIDFLLELLMARNDYKTSPLIILETIEEPQMVTATSMIMSYIEFVVQSVRLESVQKKYAEDLSRELDEELKGLTNEE